MPDLAQKNDQQLCPVAFLESFVGGHVTCSVMRKQPLTNRELMRVIKTSQHRTRLELVLDFDRSVSILNAKEWTRRLMDHMEISVSGLELPEELGEVSLKSGELKRIVKVKII